MSNTPARHREQAALNRPIETFRDRDAFMRAVLADPRLTIAERAIIVRLALHLDAAHGTLSVKYLTVAKELGISERTVMRAIAKAAAIGWIEIERRPGKTNHFRLQGVTNSCHPSGVTNRAGRGDSRRQGGVTPRCQSLSEESNTGVPKGTPCERESDALARVSITDGEAALLRGAPAEDSDQVEIESHDKSPDIDAAYVELRTVWQRPWPDDARADRQAFELACEEVTPGEIVEAATAWAEAVEARFLPSLAKWLAGRGWEKTPPRRTRATHCGSTRRNGRKVDLAALALEAGDYNPAEGSLVWGHIQ